MRLADLDAQLPGQFNLTVRNYFAKEGAYDGSYKVPPIRREQ